MALYNDPSIVQRKSGNLSHCPGKLHVINMCKITTLYDTFYCQQLHLESKPIRTSLTKPISKGKPIPEDYIVAFSQLTDDFNKEALDLSL